MTDLEKRTFYALACMADQYLHRRIDGVIDSDAMNAGENAIEVLAECGYVELIPGGRIMGRWTKAGKALLEWGSPFGYGGEFPEPIKWPKVESTHDLEA